MSSSAIGVMVFFGALVVVVHMAHTSSRANRGVRDRCHHFWTDEMTSQ